MMRPALRTSQPVSPTAWEELPCGDTLQHIVEQTLEGMSRQMFGYHLVKVGHLSSQLALPHCPIKHVVNVTDKITPFSQVIADPHHLPFEQHSIDAMVLAFQLDFAQDPHQILREVDRVLIPNGNLMIVGFNPMSLTGLIKCLPWHRQHVLHQARFFSSMRIKDWLHLLGFEVIDQQRKVFNELINQKRISPESRWQKWGERYLPWISSVYTLVAKKRVMPLSLIKPQWKPNPNFSAIGASMSVKGPGATTVARTSGSSQSV